MSTGRVPRTLLVAVIGALLLGGLVPTVNAQNPVYGVDDRVFPEPMMATSFLQFPDFIAGIDLLNAAHSQYMDVRVIGHSVEGRPILFVEVTNENSDIPRDDKLQIGYSASIHANEAAGREGMVRAIEDLVTGTGPLGDLQPMLDQLILNVWFPNPDSWASGDHFTVDPEQIFEGGPSYYRTNVNNVDLNREFPNPGLIEPDHTPMSEPESQAVVKELRYSGRHTNLVAGTDMHGMINSPNMMRAIIPNQDMDFHRMMVSIRYLQDLEQRVNNNEHFAEWNTLAEALCLLPGDLPPASEDGEPGAHDDHGHDLALTDTQRTLLATIDDGDGIWTLEEAQAYRAASDCGTLAEGPTGGVGHGQPFLWGARWDQIGYTDSGFTSDYLMLSPRSPTGGMGAIGTITEFAYSHMVPNNNYVAKLTDMHVAGVRETVRTQMEYTLLLEQPRLTGTGTVAYVTNEARVTSATDSNPYESATRKSFNLQDESTWFEFDQVNYDVANTDFWADLEKYSDDPVIGLKAADINAQTLAGVDTLILTDHVYHRADIPTVRAWVEAGGNLILTDAALGWFDDAGLTTDAAYMDEYYLGHSDLTDMTHPLVAGVNWNARQTAEGPPTGHRWAAYPQWHLKTSALDSLDIAVAGTTGGDPTLGTAKVGDGTVHFIGAALPNPIQDHDHRYGLAPYAVTALTYYVFVNAMNGEVAWEPRDAPFVPFYPADPLYGTSQVSDAPPRADDERIPSPDLVPILAIIGILGYAMRRITDRSSKP